MPYPNPATVNQNITFTITARNLRADKAKNPYIADNIDSNFFIVSFSASPASIIPSRNGQIITALLTNSNYTNTSTPFTLTVVVKPLCGAVPLITNTAYVDNSNNETNYGNNDASVSITD